MARRAPPTKPDLAGSDLAKFDLAKSDIAKSDLAKSDLAQPLLIALCCDREESRDIVQINFHRLSKN